jgi:hypothetical protein
MKIAMIWEKKKNFDPASIYIAMADREIKMPAFFLGIQAKIQRCTAWLSCQK